MHKINATEAQRPQINATSPAQARAQQLAAQAAVDFRSVDSLKIARLSVLLKKYMKLKGGAPALEFNELREACGEEQSFLSLVEGRLEVADTEERFKNDDAATNAPWSCQVDVLLQWQGERPLDEALLHQALACVMQQQPMLRSIEPPDDSWTDATDLLLGTRNSGLSTTAAATWSLINETGLCDAYPKVRRVVSEALYLCWPRTVLRREAPVFRIAKLAKTHGSGNHRERWDGGGVAVGSATGVADLESALALALVLMVPVRPQPIRYGDGGAIAAFVTALGDTYAALERGEVPSGDEHPVLGVQEGRLRRYLTGLPGRPGEVDVYLFDVVSDMYNHRWGHSVGTDFSWKVCELVRVAGRRLACSQDRLVRRNGRVPDLDAAGLNK
eukprot:g1110.t2